MMKYRQRVESHGNVLVLLKNDPFQSSQDIKTILDLLCPFCLQCPESSPGINKRNDEVSGWGANKMMAGFDYKNEHIVTRNRRTT